MGCERTAHKGHDWGLARPGHIAVCCTVLQCSSSYCVAQRDTVLLQLVVRCYTMLARIECAPAHPLLADPEGRCRMVGHVQP
jgi:hypothetical protein